MTKALSVFVPGIPKGQPRPRAVVRGSHAGVYDPGTAWEWKQTIRGAVTDATPLTGPLAVGLWFVMPRPKAHFRTRGGQATTELKPSSPRAHTNKPDIDNLAKAVLDAANGVLWTDDASIYSLSARKTYTTAERPEPGVDITVRAAT